MTGIGPQIDAGSRSLRDFVAAVARYQWGHVGSWQLRQWGIAHGTIDTWVRNGWLRVRIPGVYAVGHVPWSVRGDFMAAVLAVGEDARLSHISAGLLRGWVKIRHPRIDVTTPRKLEPRHGIVPHWSRHPGPTEFCFGIPVTPPERTIIDLAGVLRRDHMLVRAMNQACVDELITVESLTEALGTSRGRRGAARIRRLLHLVTRTRSGLEDEAFRAALAAGRRVETNALIGGVEVDQFDPETNTVYEIDGSKYHDNPFAAHLDAEKHAHLEGLGLRVLRVAEKDVTAN